jgi:hypothetical protein
MNANQELKSRRLENQVLRVTPSSLGRLVNWVAGKNVMHLTKNDYWFSVANDTFVLQYEIFIPKCYATKKFAAFFYPCFHFNLHVFHMDELSIPEQQN